MKAQVEYHNGPFDGRTEDVLLGVDQMPGDFRVLAQDAYYRSVFDDEPMFPAQDHTYHRHHNRPVRRGNAEVWIYTWSGPLH